MLINSLWHSDAIKRQGTQWILLQVMACCPTAPSHYLNHCWLLITNRFCSIHLRTISCVLMNLIRNMCSEITPWWRHQLKTFSALLAICAGNSPVTVNSPHKGQWRGALMFSSICAWIDGWENSREAGDLRRYRAHYDVTVMLWNYFHISQGPVTWSCPRWNFAHAYSHRA